MRARPQLSLCISAPRKPNPDIQGNAVGARKSKEVASAKKVPIDEDTNVPLDLYVCLMKAAEQAKSRGQHRIEERKDTSPSLWGSRTTGTWSGATGSYSSPGSQSAKTLVLSEQWRDP